MSGHITSLGHEEVAWESNFQPTQPTTEKKYKCPQCPSSFKRPENLKRHQRGHDENCKFTCQICDKSFARSDVLGRHIAIHITHERRDDNPHRRRACRECARARDRCSKGEPCRRCVTKALCCVYPEEPRFGITMPHTRSSSVSEADDYEATGVGNSCLVSTTGSLRDVLPGDHGSSQWQVEGPSASFREQCILSPSVFTNNSLYPYLANHHETQFASLFSYDAPSPQDEDPHVVSTHDASTNALRFVTGDSEPDGVFESYHQTTGMPLKLVSGLDHAGVYQPDPSAGFQGNYIDGLPLDEGQFDTAFDTCRLSSGTRTVIPDQSESLNFSSNLTSYEIRASDYAPRIDFGQRQSHPHPLRTPYSSMAADPTAYDSIAAPFADPSQDRTPNLQFDASITAPGTNQDQFFPKMFFGHLKHNKNGDIDALEEPSGSGVGFENFNVQ